MLVYTQEEFDEHIKEGCQWLIAHNNIYDVTDLIKHSNHPGSSKALITHIGKDCTKDYDFHTSKTCWKKYQIGKLKSNHVCIIL